METSDVLRFIDTGTPRPLKTSSEPPYGEERGSYPPVPPRDAPQDAKLHERFAVALGGLGGNNAHGAGFLEALRQSGKIPQLITCTSGQLLFASKYLAGEDVGAYFLDWLRETQPFPAMDANIMFKALAPWQMITPSFRQFPCDLAQTTARMWGNLAGAAPQLSLFRELCGLWPARSMISHHDDAFFRRIAEIFMDLKDVGVMFNAYDITSGCEYVYLNDKAAALTGHVHRSENPDRSWVRYEPIDAAGVRNALRLYQYGFDGSSTMLDGAYSRGLIISEIPSERHNQIDTIAAVRPLAEYWMGAPPLSLTELQDMQTEVTFNASYYGEREGVRRGNAANKRQVTFLELPLMRQRSYWDYLVEDEAVFRSAYWRGTALLDKVS